jgi:hypothetical protein
MASVRKREDKDPWITASCNIHTVSDSAIRMFNDEGRATGALSISPATSFKHLMNVKRPFQRTASFPVDSQCSQDLTHQFSRGRPVSIPSSSSAARISTPKQKHAQRLRQRPPTTLTQDRVSISPPQSPPSQASLAQIRGPIVAYQLAETTPTKTVAERRSGVCTGRADGDWCHSRMTIQQQQRSWRPSYKTARRLPII